MLGEAGHAPLEEEKRDEQGMLLDWDGASGCWAVGVRGHIYNTQPCEEKESEGYCKRKNRKAGLEVFRAACCYKS